MRIILIIILNLFFFIFPWQIFAISSPIQITPTNNSTVSTSTMSWQSPSYELYSGGNPYRIQVDSETTFTDPDKDYYTTGTSYSPALSNGTWYWRIKSKDASGTWSDWSSVWSFILDPTSSSSPSPSPNSSPTSSFTISNIPTEINSDQTFRVSANLSLSANPNSKFYLKEAFRVSGSSNYFGLTKVGSSWIKNSQTYSDQYSITTDANGNWSGNLEIQPDVFDSGYDGNGDYLFKIGRYTSEGSGPTWSNEVTIKINAKEVQMEEDLTLNLSKTSSSKSSSPKSKLEPKEDLPEEVYLLERYSKHSTVAGITAAEQNTTVKENKQNFPIHILGILLILLAAGYIVYSKLKNRIQSPL